MTSVTAAASPTEPAEERAPTQRPPGLLVYLEACPCEAAGNECGQRLGGRLTPSDAEGVASGIGVDLKALVAVEIGSGLQQPGAERECLLMRRSCVIDVKIEMHLLRTSVRPVRRDVVGGGLDADPPLASGVDDTVPSVIREHVPAEHARPEGTLCAQVSRVEHDDVAYQLHDVDPTNCLLQHRHGGEG